MKVLYYLLVLFVFLHSGSAMTEYFVRTNKPTDCPGECLTLNEYVHNTEKYFTSNTAFIFLDGEHYFDTRLLILSQSDISMNGTSNVTINMSPYAYIMVFASQEIKMSSLEIKYNGYEGEEKDDITNSAMFLYLSQNVTLTNIKFSKLPYPGPNTTLTWAVLIAETNVILTNCSSYNGVTKYGGGAVYISRGTAYFSGVNFFAFNKADKGGAIYIEDSVAVFNGTNTFRENRGSPGELNLEPDAIHIKNSIVAFQGEVNFIGNSALFGGSSDVSGVSLPQQ